MAMGVLAWLVILWLLLGDTLFHELMAVVLGFGIAGGVWLLAMAVRDVVAWVTSPAR